MKELRQQVLFKSTRFYTEYSKFNKFLCRASFSSHSVDFLLYCPINMENMDTYCNHPIDLETWLIFLNLHTHIAVILVFNLSYKLFWILVAFSQVKWVTNWYWSIPTSIKQKFSFWIPLRSIYEAVYFIFNAKLD